MKNIQQAIDKLGAAIGADPAKARAKNAPAMGGTASGPNPGWLFRGSLAACTATVIAMRVESESDNRGILGLDEKVSAGLGNLRTRVAWGTPTRRSPARCETLPQEQYRWRWSRAERFGAAAT